MKPLAPAFVYLSPSELTLHTELNNFPALPDEQLATLTQSIKERGVLEPLVCTPDHEVYGGRSRWRIAHVLELPKIPVLIRPESDVVGYAIETAIARRQLTKSAVVLFLMEHHPDVGNRRGKKGNPKLIVIKSQLGTTTTYSDLADRYRVPREYFFLLAEMREQADEAEWAEIRRVILEQEASIPRQYAGFKTGRPAGSKRGAVIYAAVSEQGLLEGILPRAFASIRQGFSRWSTEINSQGKAAVEKEWAELLDEAPPELLRIAKRKAAQLTEGRK